MRLQRSSVFDGGVLFGTVALLAERQHSASFGSRTREAALGAFTIVGRQRDEELRYQEQVTVIAEAGSNDGGAYRRQRSAFFFGTGVGARPLSTVRLSFGTMGGGDGTNRERFANIRHSETRPSCEHGTGPASFQ